jgi:hypothetical protein
MLDHAHDLLGPALRVEPRLYAAQRVPHQHIRSRYGPGLEGRVQVVHHVGEDLRPGPGITEDEFESRRVSPVAAMPIHGQLNVRALNDGFTALNSVVAMSQSGRFETSEREQPPTIGGETTAVRRARRQLHRR